MLVPEKAKIIIPQNMTEGNAFLEAMIEREREKKKKLTKYVLR